MYIAGVGLTKDLNYKMLARGLADLEHKEGGMFGREIVPGQLSQEHAGLIQAPQYIPVQLLEPDSILVMRFYLKIYALYTCK